MSNVDKFPNQLEFFKYNQTVSAPLHIIVLVEDKQGLHFSKFRKILELIKSSLFYLTTTKCLVLFYRIEDSYKNTKNIFFESYLGGFSDFVVAQSVYKKPPILITYDYALDYTLVLTDFNQSFSVFYEKIKNLKGINIRVGVDLFWPKSYTDNYGLPASKNLRIYLKKSYELFESSLNITTNFVPLNDNEDRYVQLKNYNLAMFLSSDILLSFHNINNIYILRSSNFGVLVPKIYEKKITLSRNMLYSFLAFSSVLIFVIVYARYYKFNRNEWSFLNIFHLMLGSAVTIYPRCLRSKIVMITLMMFSIFCISDIITDLTTVKYKSNKVLFVKSIEDVFKKENIFKKEKLEHVDMNLPAVIRAVFFWENCPVRNKFAHIMSVGNI